MVLANVGNLVHSFYVFSLPPGPLWALHTFYLVSTLLMLCWCIRYEPGGLRRITHVFAPLRCAVLPKRGRATSS
jgi:hypothetical protein